MAFSYQRLSRVSGGRFPAPTGTDAADAATTYYPAGGLHGLLARRRLLVLAALIASPLVLLALSLLWQGDDRLSNLKGGPPPGAGPAGFPTFATGRPAHDSPRLGAILSPKQSTLTSPDGTYSLVLRPEGDLVLVDNAARRPVWWTSTGDGRRKGGHSVSVKAAQDGRNMLVVEARMDKDWETAWHSDMEPACREARLAAGSRDEEEQEVDGMGSLQLFNSGRLRIRGVCDLYVPPEEREQERSLALIVTGLYRTHDVTCPTHVRHLVANNHSSHQFTRVDVFAYLLYEDADITTHGRTPQSIEAAARACYGEHLRVLRVASLASAEEDYPGGTAAMLPPCGPKLRRLNNQLKTLDTAASLWWGWSIEHGFQHDTVLRIRPDTFFFAPGRLDDRVDDPLPPQFWTLRALGDDTLVLPHPRNEHYFYCGRAGGRIGVGPTDQLAYGSPVAMRHWLHMYRDFAQMVDLAANADRPALRDFSGCENLPTGPTPAECPRPAPCSIECLVAWYLEARGVRFAIEWGWEQGLRREHREEEKVD